MRICILGATGLVGRELLTLIDRAWPEAELALFASRDQSLAHAGRELPVSAATALEADDAPRGELAFVALDDPHSARFCPRLLELGYRVIDKSNTYRLDPQVPLAVAGVNHGRVDDATPLVANPNCTTIPLTLALRPLAEAFGLREVSVSSYQAISGAGLGALDGFVAAAAEGFAAMREAGDRLGTSLDAAGYAGNTVPHSGKTDASGFSSEERKLMLESRKILEQPELAICAQCCRVPVAVGHYENVWLELATPCTAEALAATFDGALFVDLLPGAAGEGLTALATVHRRDRVLVGRLRADPRQPQGARWCLTVAADNLRLGAATNAVRVASRWFASRDTELQV